MSSVSDREANIIFCSKMYSFGYVTILGNIDGKGVIRANDATIGSGEEGIAAPIGKERGHDRGWIDIAGTDEHSHSTRGTSPAPYWVCGSSHTACKILHSVALNGENSSSWQGLARGTVAMSWPPRE